MNSITQLTVLTLLLVILVGSYVNHSELPIALEATPSFSHESETTSAEASGPTSVTLDAIRPFEEAEGYTYAEATMRGTVERDDGSEGEYAVPIVLIYPHDGGNGIGVVDWLNTGSLDSPRPQTNGCQARLHCLPRTVICSRADLHMLASSGIRW